MGFFFFLADAKGMKRKKRDRSFKTKKFFGRKEKKKKLRFPIGRT